MIKTVSAADIDRLLTFPALVPTLERAFAADIVTPVRHHHDIARGSAPTATMLLMPAWTGQSAVRRFLGTKIVSVFPDNPGRGKPSVVGVYILYDGDTGEPLCLMDGPRITLWRTAAASALAARRLARADASKLVMVGAGALSRFLVLAHASVRPISEVTLWNRNAAGAEALAASLAGQPFGVRVTTDLEAAVRGADIVSCATMSPTPLILGDWLRLGAHLDLVGAFRPGMRESDDEAVRRASLFCDTRAGAMKEAGDLAIPLANGLITAADIRADLFDFAHGRHAGRASEDEITLFKSVGTAIEDLAAAMLVYEALDLA
jgi:ornithine cyclodeaminase/alanine dehydrogenase-like protein (mu-crystallin family)